MCPKLFTLKEFIVVFLLILFFFFLVKKMLKYYKFYYKKIQTDATFQEKNKWILSYLLWLDISIYKIYVIKKKCASYTLCFQLKKKKLLLAPFLFGGLSMLGGLRPWPTVTPNNSNNLELWTIFFSFQFE